MQISEIQNLDFIIRFKPGEQIKGSRCHLFSEKNKKIDDIFPFSYDNI